MSDFPVPKHRVGTVFGDKKRAKTDLSATAINAHARLIIVRDAQAAMEIIRRRFNLSNLPAEEIEVVNNAIAELDHHWFMHREELEPVGWPSEELRKATLRQALGDPDYEGTLDFEDEDEERDVLNELAGVSDEPEDEDD